MIFPYTFYYHGASAILAFASFIYAFLKYRHQIDITIRLYGAFFFFFFLCQLFLSLPFLLFKELNIFFGFFYATALLFLAISTWFAIQFSWRFLITDIKIRNILSIIYFLGVIIFVLLHFIYPEVPKSSSDSRWIFWYSWQFPSIIYSFFMIIAGWSFTCLSFMTFLRLESFILKLRSVLFALSGFVLPLAAYFYFGSQRLLDIYLGSIFTVLGILLFFIGNVIIGFVLVEKKIT